VILPIVQAGDPVLRQTAQPLSLDDIGTPAIQQLIADMRETMCAAPGVGLAAPQVGLSLQLAVIEDAPEYLASATADELRERDRTVTPFHVIINPVITLLDEAIDFYEGCLSVDGWLALVPRAKRVKVDALNERGEDVRLDVTGWHARILQHEIDHLKGVLCVDRMDPRTLSTHANYSKHWRGLASDEVRSRLHAPRR
jgi:peptide deformylase